MVNNHSFGVSLGANPSSEYDLSHVTKPCTFQSPWSVTSIGSIGKQCIKVIINPPMYYQLDLATHKKNKLSKKKLYLIAS